MKSVFATIALFASLAVADTSFTINTPSNVAECEPTLISWTGGASPYYLSILPGSDPSGNALETFPAINTTSITWQVNIQSGTSIGFTLRDSDGNLQQTAAVTVQSGAGDSCLSTTSYAAGSTGGSSGSSSTPSGTSASQTSAGTTTPASSASSASASATSTSTSTSSNGGAPANAAQLGVAAMVGVALGALFF